MKINSQNPLTRPTQTTPREETQPVKGATSAKQQEPGPSAATHLSQKAADTSRDVDMARVEEIREAIREGRLEVRAERIADALIESLAAERRGE
ncbi:flagellar biosynthesis anti-sigma factor FlgM [Halomonas sp. MCCC 1A17488]|uniref:Negative regulator of flagellin synthesis n=1 Tax=Billgrantia sulfidoxydans TaxID=2733484 RepID=A0ABX7W6N1_9GAMM|nr:MULTISPECIES: flagellar biosynthesis anti-sigma factor FlgM [Halomonas]MCE8014775.1 flagellar biosynthesis anti-sigma factor FlgM [Halomonas sp. MCCC 1A17488]MCG3238108.1 flagellar biosynthesis anti-sigma factor FlgM [Halomonas sp. MCCC 1A17488]QPP48121.1 flagellar biosynthesis anti-sigma factor FlgM [Halomonas sp. SS10-MC5]QTP55410.1 flagellar biosynthesis anti-sigma factor FlgM [Halomonas sulfidoxydans]